MQVLTELGERVGRGERGRGTAGGAATDVRLKLLAGLAVAAGAVAGTALLAVQGGDDGPRAPTPFPLERTLRIKETVSIGNIEWPVRTFNSDARINFILTNKSGADLKDIEIACDFLGADGTVRGQTRSILRQTIRARTQKTVHDFDIGTVRSESSGVSCFVSDLRPS